MSLSISFAYFIDFSGWLCFFPGMLILRCELDGKLTQWVRRVACSCPSYAKWAWLERFSNNLEGKLYIWRARSCMFPIKFIVSWTLNSLESSQVIQPGLKLANEANWVIVWTSKRFGTSPLGFRGRASISISSSYLKLDSESVDTYMITWCESMADIAEFNQSSMPLFWGLRFRYLPWQKNAKSIWLFEPLPSYLMRKVFNVQIVISSFVRKLERGFYPKSILLSRHNAKDVISFVFHCTMQCVPSLGCTN